jgi:hypothetical protein
MVVSDRQQLDTVSHPHEKNASGFCAAETYHTLVGASAMQARRSQNRRGQFTTRFRPYCHLTPFASPQIVL